LGLLLAIAPIRLYAQAGDVPPTDKKAADSAKGKVVVDTSKHLALITRNDVIFAGLFIGATVGVAQLDREVAQKLQDTSRLPSVLTTTAAKTFNYIGLPGAVALSAGTYLIGRVAKVRGLADAGLHTGEAWVLAEVATYAIKTAFGRERPYFAGPSDPDDFKFGRGLKGEAYSSFPSGHASGAFAAAASATAEISSRWPKAAFVFGPILYGGAAMVGWARLQSNKHWLSDVFLGAGIGTMVGIKVVRYNHKHANNWLDRLLLGNIPTVTANRSGVMLLWSKKI
jgi:membrane-associated phospholipid phosphatase